MKRLHLIWDLDGTLIDSEHEVLDSLIKAVRASGISEEEQKSPFRVGPTIDRMLDNAFGSEFLTAQRKAAIITSFRSIYDNCGFSNTMPFAGIKEILVDSCFCHHIVTNKPDMATGRILKKLGWNGLFASVITPYSFIKTENDRKKTKAELFDICMSNYEAASFIGIGDMEGDAQAAKAVGIPALGVLWGTGTEAELAACDAVFSDTNGLHTYLRTLGS